MGSDGEKSSDVEDPMKQLFNYGGSNKEDEFSDFDSDDMLEAHEIQHQWRKMGQLAKSNKNMRKFL